MKFNKKNAKHFYALLFIFTVICTLLWAVIERAATAGGGELNLSAGPVTLDLYVLKISLFANPGTAFGLPLAFLVFNKL